MVAYQQGERLSEEHAKFVAVLIPQQMDLALFRDNCSHPDKRQVDVFAHGIFPTEDPLKQVILESWLEVHEQEWARLSAAGTPPTVEAFGLDVARSLDGDATCLAAGGQKGLRATHKWKFADTTYHVGEVLRIARELYSIDLRIGRTPVCVDMDGLGAGVGDQLRQFGVWVIEFRGNASSQVDPRTYVNLRAEAYATLGRRLNPDDRWRGQPWALPASETLRQELCAPEKIHGADALRFGITPKNKPPDRPEIISIKDKLGRSPDEADAVVYLFHALRILFDWNAYFQQSTAPLAVWPSPEAIAKERDEKERKARGMSDDQSDQGGVDWLRPGDPGETKPADAPTPPAPADPMLEQLKKLTEFFQTGKVENGKAATENQAAEQPGNWVDRVKWEKEERGL
jgi:hypothetical protein